MANTWLMWGIFPVSLFFSGFATAGDLDKQAAQIDKVQKSIERQTVLVMQGQLSQLFDSMCGAYRNNRQEEAVQWERQFTTLLLQYNAVSPQPYPMRRCG